MGTDRILVENRNETPDKRGSKELVTMNKMKNIEATIYKRDKKWDTVD